ncbi:MAG: RNA polymerase sigma factor [Myxococcota bacterium]|jgi:RNA polymerase sigma-70 factor (ECF subfamily)
MTALALGNRLMTNELATLADPLRPLALAARDGESIAFTRLYERTREQAWRVLYRVVGPSPDLEDLLQEAYLQLMKALQSYRGDSKVSTFLHRVCVNVGLMYLRGRRRRPEELSDEVPERPATEHHDPERAAQVKQAAALVQRALSTLSEEKAAVFVYHDLLGMKPEEIAELVDCPVNTVRSRLNRARQDFTQAVAKLKGGAR